MNQDCSEPDLLTGLSSRRFFEEQCRQEILRAGQEGGRPVPHATVSGGVAAFPTDGRTQSEVTRKATKTTHFTITQLERLAMLAKEEGVGEAVLLREALDDLLIKYKVSGVES